MKLLDTIQRALTAAGLDARKGPSKDVSETIAQALSAAGLGHGANAPVERATVIEVLAPRDHTAGAAADGHAPIPPGTPAGSPGAGEFVSRSYSNDAGTRTYKLYRPASYAAAVAGAVPMVVMLHGCTQSPDDFAAGTRMNALADLHGFLVVYPEQAANANGSKCWNWFRPDDQGRDRGEPSIIAGITRNVAAVHRVDEGRIFVAGLSAGAAMAVILGATYPELYAAVGAHSGLPYGAAHDMPSAFGAMSGSTHQGRTARRSGAGHRPTGHGVPTIVFHGDQDRTVHARNGAAIVEQATAGRTNETRLRTSVREGADRGGRRHRQTVHADEAGRPVVEQWDLHGAGHAWSGGSPDGSFTDAGGPDASAEMVRFFHAQRSRGAA